MSRLKSFLFGTRRRGVLTVLILATGLYAILGFLVAPGVAKPRIVAAVSELTGREASLERLQLNPFTLSGTLTGFSIRDVDGETLLSLGRVKGNLQAYGFLFREIHFKEVDLEEPYFRIQIKEDGSLNVADILNRVTGTAESTEEAETGKGWHLKVGLLRVVEGDFSFADLSRSTPFRTRIAPIPFDVTEFHTSGESDAPYSFSAASESGEALSWKGFVALAPFRSKGSFQLDNISMPKYEPYYDIVLNTDIAGGILRVSADYEYTSGEDGLARLENGMASFEGLEVVDSDNREPVIKVAEGGIEGLSMDQMARSAKVGAVRLSSGQVFIKRLEDGRLDVLNHIKSSVWQSGAAPEPAESSEPRAALAYQVDTVELTDFSILFTDRSTAAPAEVALDAVHVKLENISSAAAAPVDLHLSAVLRSGGSIQASGQATIQPLGADLSLELQEIELSPANPYIAEKVNLSLQGGKLGLLGKSNMAIAGQGPQGSFSGDLWLQDFALAGEAPLVSFSRLEFSGIEASYNETALAIEEIGLADANISVRIDAEGVTNLSLPKDGGPEAVEEETGGAGLSLPFPVSIGRIVLENAGASLVDERVSPSVRLGLKSLSGTVSGLSSEELARADLDLKGTLSDGTRLSVNGKINPLIEDRYSDVTVSFNDFNLTEVSPYAAKYTGYPLSKGKLSFDLSYQISQANLKGENVMTIDQLTLGQKVPSEDAVNLPLPLAVSLLKDSKGVIEIDVPVSGDLNDPEFSFGRVIGRALFNIVTKLVTSPFSILGGLVPGGAEMDLSQVAFVPGSASLDDRGLEVLKILATALMERPNLNLEIVGRAGGAEEIVRLKQLKLENALRELRHLEMKSRERATIPVEQVQLTEEERQQMMGKLFKATFPEGLPSRPAEVVEPPSPALPASEPVAETAPGPEPVEKKGLGLRGLIRTIFGGTETSEPTPAETAASPQAPTPPAATMPKDGDMSLAEMEDRLLESMEIAQEELRELADLRAAAVRAFLEQEAAVPAGRLFVTLPDDESAVSASGGSPSVAFQLE